MSTGRARGGFDLTGVTGVSAEDPPAAPATIPRAGARPGGRPDARLSGVPHQVLPVDKGANLHAAPPPVDVREQKRELRLLGNAAAALAAVYAKAAERATDVRTEIDRCRALTPEQINATLLLNGVTGDMLTP